MGELGVRSTKFDFTVYAQLSTVLTAVFFPSSSESASLLSFWGVFAVGFISRPLGAMLFGHVGDAYGRRITMLLTILLITLPTVLIGCLPSYHMIGIAAPVLLAILRFLQGLAVGGEFGGCIVYLFEIAPKHRKALFSSFGQAAIAPGIILGILVCLAVIYPCSKAQLELWGWRIPFLVTIITTPIAIIMRMHMPEPYEFMESAGKMKLERVASTAAHKVARTYSRQISKQASSVRPVTSHQLSRRLHDMTHVVASPLASPHQSSLLEDDDDAYFLNTDSSNAAKPTTTSNKDATTNTAADVAADAAACAKAAHKTQSYKKAGSIKLYASPSMKKDADAASPFHHQQLELQLDHDNDPTMQECEKAYAKEVTQLAPKIKHHVPLAVLFKDHWVSLLLQFLVEAALGSGFYTWFSWAPAYVRTAGHVKLTTSLWAVLLGMIAFLVMVPLGGHLSDKGAPKVTCFMALVVAGAAICIPVLLALHTGSLVAVFLLLPLMMGITGLLGGFNVSILPLMYPAGVRASGFNIGHNAAMVAFGGCLPFMIQALSMALQPGAVAAGVILIILAVVALCAAVGIMKHVPMMNARGNNHDHVPAGAVAGAHQV
ncbi:hypothetical protein OEZ86_000955 [Tetradesmus obliquus]|nr:hypothetical protein OEZ86_000955 [Tetradesmus obliquus]